ncbi:OprO/OprP family phosphate-selective porin [Aureliella helgolandensis]|uniref:Porin P n=1 Tax=Aureliella helgolandensis TaxID=2527968 RepID=A0A518G7F3_9BACT|nr:porin [Aureliella helgolandensis]QDV24512.1 Porin P precursor [Aureliella helgolandensis]
MNLRHTSLCQSGKFLHFLRLFAVLSSSFSTAAWAVSSPVLAQSPQSWEVNSQAEFSESSSPPSQWQQEATRLQQQIDELQALRIGPPTSSPTKLANDQSATSGMLWCTPPAMEKPKFPTARLTGFFQADALWASQSLDNRVAVGKGVAADGDVQDGADFRRARIAATGQAWDNIAYMLEMDFAFPGRPSFMDVWMDIDDVLGSNKLRIGQYRQPFGMDGLTSVKEMTFLERGLPFAFLPFRQIGTMLHGYREDELATWAISGFRFPTDTYGGNVGDNGGYGLASRITGLLFKEDEGNGLLHIGGGYSYIDPANDLIQYRNQPELFVGETGGGAALPTGVPTNLPPFVDTGLIATDHVNLANVELAMSYGSFYAQSEAIVAVVSRQDDSALTLPGAYANAGYFLTGESRPYNGKGGVFGRVQPNRSVGKDGGIGALELAGRWSYIDLNDKNIQGGRLNNLTSGLNWYINPNTKFQFNYIHAMLNSPINHRSNADLFAVRAQLDF